MDPDFKYEGPGIYYGVDGKQYLCAVDPTDDDRDIVGICLNDMNPEVFYWAYEGRPLLGTPALSLACKMQSYTH